MTNWNKIKISDIAEVIGGGTPSTKQPEFWGNDIPWLTPKDLSGYNNRYILSGERSISNEGLKNSSARILPKGSILLTSRAPIGYLAIAEQELCTNQGFKSLILKQGNNSEFFYYLLKNNIEYIKNMSSGSTFAEISGSQVKNLEFSIPPLETQEKIAKVLSAIDDKIELNNSINNNLEQQAQAIFLELFKNKIDNVEFNNNKQLKELVQNVDNRGKTPPCTTVKTLYPIIDVRALSGNTRIIDYNKCTKYVEKDTYDNWFRNGHPQKYDILLSTVGSLAEMKLFMGQIGCIAQNVVGYRCNISPLYLYQYLNFIKKDLLAYDIGSVQPSIKVTHIAKHPIYIPSKNELEKFHSISEAITNKIYNNCKENEYLTQLRDTLLPKLMSGEIDVSEVDISTDKLLFSEEKNIL